MQRPRRQRHIIDSNVVFHSLMVKYWQVEEREFLKETRIIPNRFEKVASALKANKATSGDALVQKIKDTFHNGFGIKFGEDQIRVYNAFIASCLPLIYSELWPEEKTRVLKDWGLNREAMYSLVNMARRNGKTFVTSATAAALLLCVPGIRIAIFSEFLIFLIFLSDSQGTCKRWGLNLDTFHCSLFINYNTEPHR